MGQAYAVTALDGVAFGMLLFVVAAGLTLIFGVMQVFNLAHGTLYLAGAYLAWMFGAGLPGLAATVALALLVGAGVGALLSLVLPHQARDAHSSHALITLGIAFLTADAFTTVFGPEPRSVTAPAPLDGSVQLFGHGYPSYRLVFIAVAALIAAALYWSIRRSTAGLLLRAAVTDPAMAAATGIPTAAVRTTALAVGGSLAVTGGALGAPLLGPAPGVDTTVLTLSLIVVVLGGAGSIPATLAAALLVGQIQTVGVIATPTLAPFALFAALLLALVVRGRHAALTVGRPA